MFKIKRIGADRILVWLIMFLIVVTTTDTVLFGTNDNILWPKSVQVCLILASIILMLESLGRNKKISLSKMVVFLLMCLLVLISGVFNEDLRFGYIYKMSLFFFSMFVIQFIKIEEFAVYYDKILYILSVASLVGYVIIFLFPVILNYASTITNSAGYVFRNFWFFVIEPNSSYLRSYGIFREPGVYQMYLIIACLFQIYILPICSLKRIFIYSLVLITTFSTTGYIAFSMVMLLIIIKYPPLIKQKKTFISAILIGLCLVFLAIFFFPEVFNFLQPVFSKFSSGDAAFISFFSRTASIKVNYHLWLMKPFAGVGLTKIDKLFPVISEKLLGVAVLDNTNTFLVQLAAHGLLYCGIWIFGFLKGAYLIGNNYIERILLMGIIMVLSIGQNLTFSPIANVLLWYCLFGKNLKQKQQQIQYNSVLNIETLS